MDTCAKNLESKSVLNLPPPPQNSNSSESPCPDFLSANPTFFLTTLAQGMKSVKKRAYLDFRAQKYIALFWINVH